jgi:hypothetical protein
MYSVGDLRKMLSSLNGDQVQYQMIVGDSQFDLNPFVGKHVSLHYQGEIHCIACGRKTSKSYSQGHCYPCSQTLASCDLCIMKPETCHYHQGTCRQPSWGEENCFIDHTVYLSNTSGVKVGITRNSQIPTRWIDQGATQAVAIISAKNRRLSGLVETALKPHIADKTDWRKMLKGDADALDLNQVKQSLLDQISSDIVQIQQQYDNAISVLEDQPVTDLVYPVLCFPQKIKSHNLDKTPLVEGMLHGIKGQYLIFDSGVINIRKYAGYRVAIKSE